TKAVLDLANLKSDSGRKLDPSHIYIVGFWSLGNAPFKISRVYLSDNPEGDTGLDDVVISTEGKTVDVYNLQGMKLKCNVSVEDASTGLQPGIYVIDGRKITVTR
ncbi:MAG: T9SS type A sorting domain-containing protein, partial [Duncaniella sp.]|nr:T9SS type A sorting domain-containing protein [Duncaniella sp.]